MDKYGNSGKYGSSSSSSWGSSVSSWGKSDSQKRKEKEQFVKGWNSEKNTLISTNGSYSNKAGICWHCKATYFGSKPSKCQVCKVGL